MKQLRNIALLIVLGLAAVSCTKENTNGNNYAITPFQSATYVVDGRQYYDNPQTEEEWSAFLDHMLALAEEGYCVQFWRTGNATFSATKEKVTYTTTSHADAKRWCDEKSHEGYIVTMSYNQETGEYTCIAVR